jgi:hypothetical protein
VALLFILFALFGFVFVGLGSGSSSSSGSGRIGPPAKCSQHSGAEMNDRRCRGANP